MLFTRRGSSPRLLDDLVGSDRSSPRGLAQHRQIQRRPAPFGHRGTPTSSGFTVKRFGSAGSTITRTLCAPTGEPNVSTRVNFVTTRPVALLNSGLSTRK